MITKSYKSGVACFTRALALPLLAVSGLSTVAMAQDYALEEVVVTAQKRSESTQDIGASVSAVSGDALQEMNAFNFDEVAKMTSGINLDNANPRQQTISMRGVSYDPESSSAATVDAYWNGMSVRPDVVFGQMYDIERLEVLRGPQGTLQGKTSPAGAITMVTRRPDMEEVEGQVQSSLTEDGETTTQFGVSMPVIPGELSVRAAGVFNENELLGVENATTGKDDFSRDKAARVTIAWEPVDDFSANLAMEYSEQDLRSAEDIVYIGNDASEKTHDKYDRKALTAGDNHFTKRNRLAVLNMDWLLSDDMILSSVTGYQDNYNNDLRDLDYSNQVPGQSQWQQADISTDQISQELRLSSIEPAFWEYIAGVYYEKRDMSTDFTRDNNPGATYGYMEALDIPSEREEWGVFMHNTFNLTDSTRLQAGARWQQVRTHYRYDFTFLTPYGDYDISAVSDEDARNTDDAFTGTLKLLHDINDDVMVYASVDRSYRPSGVAIEPTLYTSSDLIYDEETSDSLEIGVKSRLFDNRLELNAALYHQAYSDYISRVGPVMVHNPTGGESQASGVMFNGDAVIQGVDVDFKAMLSEFWTLGGGVSYVDAKYDDADVPCDVTGVYVPGGSQVETCNTDGRVGGQPNWTANLNTEYLVPLDSVDVFTRAIYSFTGSRSDDFVDNSDLGGYGTMDIHLGMRDQMHTWEATLWAKNAFDKEAEASYIAPDSNDADYRRLNLIQERTIGITAKYFF